MVGPSISRSGTRRDSEINLHSIYWSIYTGLYILFRLSELDCYGRNYSTNSEERPNYSANSEKKPNVQQKVNAEYTGSDKSSRTLLKYFWINKF